MRLFDKCKALKQRIANNNAIADRDFSKELAAIVEKKCDQINHIVAGTDTPFNYTQIRVVQENLEEIVEVLKT